MEKIRIKPVGTHIENRELQFSCIDDMYQCFELAFRDYQIPFELSKDQFIRKFIDKLNINFSLSTGAYDQEVLVGFLFNSIEKYRKKLTAYNGGTGVIPGYRGLGIARNMYFQLIDLLKKHDIEQCVLEVLTKNNAAIRLYEEVGFQKMRILNCYKLYSNKLSKSEEFEIVIGENLPMEYKKWLTYYPSFLDSPVMLNRKVFSETVILAKEKESVIGFMMLQGLNGRISTLGVHPEKDLNVAIALVKKGLEISKNKQLTFLNMEENATSMSFLLESIGFVNEIKQYEMQMDITT